MSKESPLRLRVEEAEPEVAVELPEAGRSAGPRFAGPIQSKAGRPLSQEQKT